MFLPTNETNDVRANGPRTGHEHSGCPPLVTTNPRSSDWTILTAMLEQNAAHLGADAALCSDGNAPFTHQQLRDQVVAAVPALNHLGVGRNDRVTIVLPQGPELAAAFLAVAAGATAAPLNPAYTEKEFRFYLEDVSARALVLPKGSNSSARAAAGALGVPVIELIAEESGAGRFHLS